MTQPKRAARRRVAGAVVALALACLIGNVSCASVPPYTICREGEQKAVMDTLYFGTSMPGGRVTSEDWQKFLAEVITPRFPDGLTAWGAAGQWKDPAGLLQREDSYVLHLVHDDTGRADRSIHEIVTAYKERFQQQAVLRVRSPACMSF
jgi:uncharacterized protein DUF3574